MRMTLLSTCLSVAVALGLTGCASPQQSESFADQGPVWPAPPETARIRFVTQFSGPSDLGIQPNFWDRLVGFTAGQIGETMLRPMSVAAAPDGRVIFVADPDARCVHRFDLRRSSYRCLDTDPAGQLLSPIGVAIAPDGRVFVADSGLNAILVASPGDKFLRTVPLAPPPEQPTGLAIGPAGDLFIASTGTHSIRRYDSSGRLVHEYGGRGDGPGRMNFPTYLWLTPPTELLVTDTLNFRVQRLDIDDGPIGQFGEAGDGTGTLSRPKGLAMDRHGHIYVVDSMHHALQIFDRDGQLLLAIGEQGRGIGEFWLPSGVFATAEGLIFVADSYNRRVQVFRYVGDEP